MALHRDIFWVGRQWAVTGSGLQAVDQRLKGALDIGIGRLWDEELVGRRRVMPGLNLQDFDKALAIARMRFPGPDGTAAPPPVPPISPPASPPTSRPEPPVEAKTTSAAAPLRLRAEGRLARFVPQWRIRR